MSEILTAQRVDTIFKDCLFKNGEDTSEHIKAEGIMCTVGFHPARLESHRAAICEMLDELPNEFKESANGGGGWSFLNACNDKHGELWTGLHQRMDQLFQLGIALNCVKCLVIRELWAALPGGMPYYLILDSGENWLKGTEETSKCQPE